MSGLRSRRSGRGGVLAALTASLAACGFGSDAADVRIIRR
jgi:hypothetical protein